MTKWQACSRNSATCQTSTWSHLNFPHTKVHFSQYFMKITNFSWPVIKFPDFSLTPCKSKCSGLWNWANDAFIHQIHVQMSLKATNFPTAHVYWPSGNHTWVDLYIFLKNEVPKINELSANCLGWQSLLWVVQIFNFLRLAAVQLGLIWENAKKCYCSRWVSYT